MVADELDYVVGVDTHLDEHVLAWSGGNAEGAARGARRVAPLAGSF